MADLTAQLLAAKLPNGAFSETADDVTISMKAVTGDAAVQLTTESIAEFLSKMLTAAAAAEDDYNAANQGDQINSYANPNLGVPASDGSGGFTSTRTHTLTVVAPLDLNGISARPAT